MAKERVRRGSSGSSQHLSRHFSNVPAQASFFHGRPQRGALAFCTVLPAHPNSFGVHRHTEDTSSAPGVLPLPAESQAGP